MKKNIRKARPVERVYKNGREAIVLVSRRKPSSKVADKKQAVMSAATQTLTGVQEPIFKSKRQFTPIKVNEYDLPSYNVTSIKLVPKDPFWIYAYWEISKETLESVKQQLGGSLDGARFVIRMYDVSLIDFNGWNANRWFDLDVGPDANNWYINLWSDSVSYCADLAIISRSGAFFQIARSNVAHTPRAKSCDKIEEVWLDLSGEINKWPEPIQARYEEGRREIFPTIPSVTLGKKRRIYLSEDDVRRYYSRLSPLLKELVLSRLSQRRLYRYLHPGLGGYDPAYFKRLSSRVIKIGSSEMMFLGGSERVIGESQTKNVFL